MISERSGEEIAGTDPGVKQNHRHFGRDRYRIGRLFSLSYLYYAEKEVAEKLLYLKNMQI